MRQPLVTVLMPVYNAEKYLRPALESIINQTYKNLEILIINDGSTDRSEEIILGYKDPRIRYVRQENVGVGETLRRGVEMARGEIIRRMDADDITTLNSIEIQLRFLDQHTEIGLVAAQQCHITENGKVAKKFKLPKDDFFKGKAYKILTIDDFISRSSGPIVHGTAMFYRDLALKAGNYRPWFLVSEDDDLWLRIMEIKKAAILNQCLYYLRIHSSSASARYADKIKFYRSKAIEFAQIRLSGKPDPLQTGNPPVFVIKNSKMQNTTIKADGKTVRDDLNFMYSFAVNARDFKLWLKLTREILRFGWRRGKTYKMLIIPVLGPKLTNFIVSLKKLFRNVRNSRNNRA